MLYEGTPNKQGFTKIRKANDIFKNAIRSSVRTFRIFYPSYKYVDLCSFTRCVISIIARQTTCQLNAHAYVGLNIECHVTISPCSCRKDIALCNTL